MKQILKWSNVMKSAKGLKDYILQCFEFYKLPKWKEIRL